MRLRTLRFEPLEERRMLAVYLVSSLDDAGEGTLREAILLANAAPGADTIEFAPELSGQTIELSTGEMQITGALAIDARPLAENVTIDANTASQIFNITAATGDFTIAGLTLTGGKTTVMIHPQGVAEGGGIDGVFNPGEYGAPLAVQDTPTGYGDEDGGFQRGSELNAAYAKMLHDGSLQLLLTGNLESNGNGLVLFFDTRSGGAVETILPGGYGQLGTFGGQRVDDWGTDTDPSEFEFPTPGGPSILDPGFNPDFAIEFNVVGGMQYVNVIDLTVGGNSPELLNRDVHLGSAPFESSGVVLHYYRDGGQTFAGTLTHAFSNANTAGVQAYDFFDPPGTLGDPLSAITGLELLLSPELLGREAGHELKVFAYISNASGEYLSNQMLPGLGGVPNLDAAGGVGGVPLFDAREFAGNQFFVVPTLQPVLPGDYNRDGFVDGADYTVWRNTLGTDELDFYEGADGNGNGVIDEEDYGVWRANYGRYKDDHGNESTVATGISVPSVTAGVIEVGGEVDWFAVSVEAGTELRFSTTLISLPDSVLRIYDQDGITELEFDDDGGAGLASLIVWEAPADGTYFVEVRAYSDLQTGSYELSVDFDAGDDHGDEAFEATGVGIPTTVSGIVDAPFDRDWFSFAADGGTEYRFETILHTLPDSVLWVYDVDGATDLEFDDDDGPGLASLIEWTAPSTGTYYVVVGGYSDHIGAYELQISIVESLEGGGGLAVLAAGLGSSEDTASRRSSAVDIEAFSSRLSLAADGGQPSITVARPIVRAWSHGATRDAGLLAWIASRGERGAIVAEFAEEAVSRADADEPTDNAESGMEAVFALLGR